MEFLGRFTKLEHEAQAKKTPSNQVEDTTKKIETALIH
jgi:hypothetical protein